MLVFVLLFLSFCFINPVIGASGTWGMIHHVTGSDWQDVFFLDESHGWAVGSNGAVIKTEDSGKSWSILHRDYNGPLYYGCFFTSEKEGWIVGLYNGKGLILSTEDGGRNLKDHSNVPEAFFYGVCFTSQNEGWIVGSLGRGVLILHTKNAGKDWEIQDAVGLGYLSKIFFVDKNKGFAVGGTTSNTPLVYQTGDGGKTWSKQSISENKGRCEDVFFLNPLEGWIVLLSSLLKTTDGGATWQDVPIPQNIYAASVRFKNSNEGVIIGVDISAPIRSGLIMWTEDGCRSFEQQNGFSLLNDMANFDDKYWIVGNDNTIMYSEDGGNWIPQVEKAYCFRDIDFVGKNKGFLLGQSMPEYSSYGSSVIFSTYDNGSNWEQQGTENTGPSLCLDFVDESSGWIGSNGLYRVEDAGKTMRKNEAISDYISCMTFPTKDNGWVVGKNTIWRTLDGGKTFQGTKIDIGNGFLADIDVIGNKGWVVGYDYSDGGMVFITEDDGRSFNEVKVDEDLHGVSFVTKDKGWVVGNNAIFVTEDGGKSWKQQFKSDAGICLLDVLFLSEKEGWAVGGDTASWHGVILHTNDGGKTWETQMSGTIEQINKIAYAGGDYLIAVGAWGTILKYTDSSLLQYSNRFVVTDNKSQPIAWGAIKSQLYQNYPNPFNPETWIPYYLSEDADIVIKIHNSEGQLVRILNLGHKQAGSYIDKDKSAYWDGRNESDEHVSSGVYFYTIEAYNFSATKKMVTTK